MHTISTWLTTVSVRFGLARNRSGRRTRFNPRARPTVPWLGVIALAAMLGVTAMRAVEVYAQREVLHATAAALQEVRAKRAQPAPAPVLPVSRLSVAHQATVERDTSAGWSTLFTALEGAMQQVYAPALTIISGHDIAPSHALDLLSLEASGESGKFMITGEVAQLATLETWRVALDSAGLTHLHVRSLQRMATNHGKAVRFQIEGRFPSAPRPSPSVEVAPQASAPPPPAGNPPSTGPSTPPSTMSPSGALQGATSVPASPPAPTLSRADPVSGVVR